MKKYKVRFSEIKTTVFGVKANSKKEAKKMVEEIILKTSILNMSQINKTCNYKFDVSKLKNDK